MIDTIISAIPIIGSIGSAISSLTNKPEIEMTDANYESEKERYEGDKKRDIIITAKFTAANHGTTPLSISKAYATVRYEFKIEHNDMLSGVLLAKPINFKPVNIEGKHTEPFETQFLVSYSDLDFIIRQSKTMDQFKDIPPLVMEMMLKRCSYTYLIMNIMDSGKSEPKFMMWDVPLAMNFHFKYGRKGYIKLSEPIPFLHAAPKPLHVAWYISDGKERK